MQQSGNIRHWLSAQALSGAKFVLCTNVCLSRRRRCWPVVTSGCSLESSPWRPPGSAAATSTARPRLSSTTASSGARHHSATLSASCWGGFSSPTRWGRRATSRCWTRCRTPTAPGWAACCSSRRCAVRCSGPPAFSRPSVSLIWPTDWL